MSVLPLTAATLEHSITKTAAVGNNYFCESRIGEQSAGVTLLLMLTQQQKDRAAAATLKVLEDHGLSVLAASDRAEIDRGALTRMTQGIAKRVEIVERFATYFKLDANEWRELFGFKRLDAETYSERYAARIKQAMERLKHEGFPVPEPASRQGGSAGLTPEDAEVDAAVFEDAMRALFTGKTPTAPPNSDPESGKGKPNGGSARRQSGGGSGRLMSGYAW